MTTHAGSDDGGFTLVELIFYVVILGLITTGIAVFFFNTWKAQASVSDQVDNTARGQVVASQIEKAMRNAIDFEVLDGTAAQVTTAGAGGPTLVVATNLPGSAACQTFALPGTGNWRAGIVQHQTSAGTSVPYFIYSVGAVSYSFDIKDATAPAVHFEGTAYMRNPKGTQTCF